MTLRFFKAVLSARTVARAKEQLTFLTAVQRMAIP
jgi:hypothetical protein